MGVRITDTSATFAVENTIGTITGGAIDYLQRHGITDPAKVAAAKKFYKALEVPGTLAKLDYVGINEGGFAKEFNLVKPGDWTGTWNTPNSFHMHYWNRYNHSVYAAGAFTFQAANYPNAKAYIDHSNTFPYFVQICNGDEIRIELPSNGTAGMVSAYLLNGVTSYTTKGILQRADTLATVPVILSPLPISLDDSIVGRPTFIIAYGKGNWTIQDSVILNNAAIQLEQDLGL